MRGLRPSTISDLTDTKFDTILRPGKKRAFLESVTILGFDTEFTSDGKLLSVQLSGVNGTLASKVYYESTLSKEQLYDLVRQFCEEFGIELSGYVVLVAHFASAEIAHITNFLYDFHLRTFNRALEGSTEIEYYDPSGRENMFVSGEALVETVKLRIVDLFGFYPMGLERVGQLYGLDKVSLEGLGGKSEDYWKAHMDELLAAYPKKFEEYARRDPEITVLAYTHMREFYHHHHNLDILHFKTTPGIAMAIFRNEYLTAPVAPFELHPESYHARNRKTGKWEVKYRNKPFLAEPWRMIRRFALLSYWGGRNESYGRGLLKATLELYDVDSLYPTAAALQPLPNAATKWIEFSTLGEANGLEGFAFVRFEFPSDCEYPCLPVPGEMSERIYFPLKGVSWCTLAEVREALRLGARITEIHGIGFKPGPDEIDHPARQYALDFMERKRATQGAERETNKLLLNSLIGKFVETQKDVELRQILALLKGGTITPEQAPQIYKQKKSPLVKRPRDVAGGWWPEAASLILGKARALLSQFISKGAIMAVTDSVLLPKGTSIECPALDELRSVGSDLKLVHEADRAWILRTRVYVLSKNGEVVKVARHGFHMPEDEFVEWVNECVKKGEAIPLTARKVHLVSLKEVVEKGKRLGQQELRESHPKLDWDKKRLMNHDLNPFTESSAFPPQPEMPEKMRKRGRPSGQKK